MANDTAGAREVKPNVLEDVQVDGHGGEDILGTYKGCASRYEAEHKSPSVLCGYLTCQEDSTGRRIYDVSGTLQHMGGDEWIRIKTCADRHKSWMSTG